MTKRAHTWRRLDLLKSLWIPPAILLQPSDLMTGSVWGMTQPRCWQLSDDTSHTDDPYMLASTSAGS